MASSGGNAVAVATAAAAKKVKILIISAVFAIEFDVAKRTQARNPSRSGPLAASNQKSPTPKPTESKVSTVLDQDSFAAKFETATVTLAGEISRGKVTVSAPSDGAKPPSAPLQENNKNGSSNNFK